MKLTPKQRIILAERYKDLPAELPPDTFAIYTLTDPITDVVRYVGVTQHPRMRLVHHLKGLPIRSKKRQWVMELAEREQVPIMTLVEIVTATEEEALQRERHWIAHLLSTGTPLLNDQALPAGRKSERNKRQAQDQMAQDHQLGEVIQEVLIPIEQTTLAFYGRSIQVARLPDGRTCAVLRWLCDGLHLDPSGQLERIKRKTALVDGLVHVRVQTDGGPQVMPALTIDVLPGWLFGIEENRVSPETRADVVRFQREWMKISAEHFIHSRRPVIPPSPPPGASIDE